MKPSAERAKHVPYMFKVALMCQDFLPYLDGIGPKLVASYATELASNDEKVASSLTISYCFLRRTEAIREPINCTGETNNSPSSSQPDF